MAVVVVAEEAATATGLLAWVARWGRLGVGLSGLLLGSHPHEPSLNNAIGPVGAFLRAPAVVMHDMFDQAIDLAQASYNTIGALKARAHAETVGVLHSAQHLYNLARADATVKSAKVLREAQHLYNLANANTATRVAREGSVRATGDRTVLGQAQHLYNLARAYTASRVTAETRLRERADSQLLSRMTAGDKADRVYADTVSTRAAARAVGKLDSETTADYASSWAGIRSDLDAATLAAGVGLPSITALIKRVPVEAPTTLPGAAADVGALTRVMTRSLADCVIPNCRNLSKYGRDLHGLGELLGGAGFLAFLVWAVEHPETAARDTARVGGAVADETVHLVRNLIGV